MKAFSCLTSCTKQQEKKQRFISNTKYCSRLNHINIKTITIPANNIIVIVQFERPTEITSKSDNVHKLTSSHVF